MVERLCDNRPIENLYFYKEQNDFKDNCRLRFHNHDIVDSAKGNTGEQDSLGFDKIVAIDNGLGAVQENVWYQIAVYGGIGLVASCVSTILTYVVVRSRVKASRAANTASTVIGAAKAAVDSLAGSVSKLNDNLEDRKFAHTVANEATSNEETQPFVKAFKASQTFNQVAGKNFGRVKVNNLNPGTYVQ